MKKKKATKKKVAKALPVKITRTDELLERLCRDQVKVITELSKLSEKMSELIVTIKVIGNEVHSHIAPAEATT